MLKAHAVIFCANRLISIFYLRLFDNLNLESFNTSPHDNNMYVYSLYDPSAGNKFIV